MLHVITISVQNDKSLRGHCEKRCDLRRQQKRAMEQQYFYTYISLQSTLTVHYRVLKNLRPKAESGQGVRAPSPPVRGSGEAL